MVCPYCKKSVGATGLVAVAFSPQFKCRNCGEKSTKDMKREVIIYVGALVVGRISNIALKETAINSSASFFISMAAVVAAVLLAEYFFQELIAAE